MNKWNVIDVQPREDFTMLLTFYNGKKRILDFKPFLDEIGIDKLKDIDFYRRLRLTIILLCGTKKLILPQSFCMSKVKM